MVRSRLGRALSALLLAALFGVAGVGLRAAEASPHGAAPRVIVPGPGILRAGDRVELRWEGGVPDMEELEILLTVQGVGGRTFQVSPELEPGRGSFTWRVPELGRVKARLRVRFNREGHEVEGEPTAVIDILSGRDAPLPSGLAPDSRAPGVPVDRDAASARASASAAEPARREIDRPRAATGSPCLHSPRIARAQALPSPRDNTIPPFVPARN